MYENIIKFYSKSKDENIRKLSNFHIEKIVLENIEFKSGEHCFHYFKFCTIAKLCKDEKRFNELIDHSIKILNVDMPHEVKKLSNKSNFKLTNEELKIWSSCSNQFQYEICLEKIKQNKNVKEILLKTDKKYLLHQDNRANINTIWGGRIKNDVLIGKNNLGEIWMTLRAKYINV